MANELQFYGDPGHDSGLSVTAKVYATNGSQVGGTIACTEVGSLAIYHGDMPSALADVYTVRFFAGAAFIAQGTMEWDGAKEITNLSVHQAIEALNNFDPANDTVSHVTLVDTTTTNTDMRGTDNANTVAPENAAITAILSDTTDLHANQGNWLTATGFSTHAASDVWAAPIRSLTEDVDLSASTMIDIAQAVEQAILDENDGSQILNAIVGAIGNSNVDEIALVSAIRADLERSNGTLHRIENNPVDLSSVENKIDALNDLSNADVLSQTALALTNYDASTATQLTSVEGKIDALNDISDSDVLLQAGFALDTYDAVTATELATAYSDLHAHITDKQGLPTPQLESLNFIHSSVSDIDLVTERTLDLIEADETYDETSAKARKLLRGTNTVLLEKNVTGNASIESVALTD